MRPTRTLLALVCCALVGSSLWPVAARAGGGCAPAEGEITQARAGAGRPFAVAIAECSYDVGVLYVDRGSQVSWTNKDPFAHSVTGLAFSWGSDALLQQGDVVTRDFPRDGIFPYFCILHPGMVGVVVVGDPDPNQVAAQVSAAGIGLPADPGDAEAAAAGAGARSESDALSTLQLLGLISLLVVAGAIVTAAVVRRSGRLSPEA